MKKTSYVLGTILAVVMLFGACSKDDQNQDSQSVNETVAQQRIVGGDPGTGGGGYYGYGIPYISVSNIQWNGLPVFQNPPYPLSNPVVMATRVVKSWNEFEATFSWGSYEMRYFEEGSSTFVAVMLYCPPGYVAGNPVFTIENQSDGSENYNLKLSNVGSTNSGPILIGGGQVIGGGSNAGGGFYKLFYIIDDASDIRNIIVETNSLRK